MQAIKSFYKGIVAAGFWIGPVILLLMRLLWGYAFIEAGMGKWGNIENTAGFFTKLGIPFALYNAYFVAIVEMVGGAMLMAGLFSRFGSLFLASTMVVAYLTAHFDAVAGLATDPMAFTKESPFMFLLTSLLVFSFGPGMFSIDALLKRFVFKS